MNTLARTLFALSIGACVVIAGCGQGSPESAQAEPEQDQTQDSAAEAQPAGPEIIDQAEGERVNPIETKEDSAADDGNAELTTEQPIQNPLIGLPGIAPTTASQAATDEPNDASSGYTGPLQVLVQATVYELTPSTPADLAPIEQFLNASGSQTLTPDAVGAFGELVASLSQAGVITLISSPSVLVPSGTEATIEVTQMGGGQIGGLPTARSSLRFSVSPTARTPDDETQPPTVDVRYAVKFAEPDSAFQVVAQDLGLNIGSRGKAAGTTSVSDQETFFFVCRVVGDDTDRELLVLVRPKVLKADLTK